MALPDTQALPDTVTSREGRVSRNWKELIVFPAIMSHVPRGACE